MVLVSRTGRIIGVRKLALVPGSWHARNLYVSGESPLGQRGSSSFRLLVHRDLPIILALRPNTLSRSSPTTLDLLQCPLVQTSSGLVVTPSFVIPESDTASTLRVSTIGGESYNWAPIDE